MPSGEYSSVSRGALKIKGVQGSKVDKHKKKKKKAKDGSEEVTGPSASKEQEKTGSGDDGNTRQEQALDDTLREEDGNVEEPIPERGTGKTEVEKNFDERRRKMLNERLKREGVKSHKERVESLNRYLSSLSEHHDMPRIGPG